MAVLGLHLRPLEGKLVEEARPLLPDSGARLRDLLVQLIGEAENGRVGGVLVRGIHPRLGVQSLAGSTETRAATGIPSTFPQQLEPIWLLSENGFRQEVIRHLLLIIVFQFHIPQARPLNLE